MEPSRYQIAKDNASIASIVKTIEEVFGLPPGSVKLVNPSGIKAYSDSTVENLRKAWEKS